MKLHELANLIFAMKQIITLNNFPKDYRQTEIKEIFSLVLKGKFCQLICIPGGGKATILKLIASNQNLRRLHLKDKFDTTRIIYLDLHELPNFQQEQIEKFLLLEIDPQIKPQSESLLLTKQLKETLSSLVLKNINIVFLLDHFDEFQNRLPTSFLQLLSSFRSLNKYKFAAVFGTRRDLKELVDPQILLKFYDFFTANSIYLKIYDEKATQVIFDQVEQGLGTKLTKTQKEKIFALTSGHAKLTRLLAETFLREKIQLDYQNLQTVPHIAQTLFEIWSFLTAGEQQMTKAIAKGEKPDKNDVLENLIKFDLIKPTGFSFTIPLFEEFVQKTVPNISPEKITYDQNSKEIKKGTNIISDLLSPQEYRLLKFLIENEGKIIQREEIISAVWPEAQLADGISDEAIDQMVFRLRKKIEEEPNSPKHIQTVKGRGLRFVP